MWSRDPIEPSVERAAIEPEQVRFPRFIPAAQREHALGAAPIELVEGKHLVERDPHDVSVEELQFNCRKRSRAGPDSGIHVDLMRQEAHAECVLRAACQDWRLRRFRAKAAKDRKGRQAIDGEEGCFAVLGGLCAKSPSLRPAAAAYQTRPSAGVTSEGEPTQRVVDRFACLHMSSATRARRCPAADDRDVGASDPGTRSKACSVLREFVQTAVLRSPGRPAPFATEAQRAKARRAARP